MWEDFMRGNWPAAAPAAAYEPAESSARRSRTATDAPASQARQPAVAASGYPGTVAEAREGRPRKTHRRRRMTTRLAAAFGTG